MTNWDYYEAALRFQSVLQVSGALKVDKGCCSMPLRCHLLHSETELEPAQSAAAESQLRSLLT